MFRYFTGFKDRHENLESLLLILRPGGKPQNFYEKISPLGQPTRHQYWLRCLWEHPVEELLESGLPGLLPFVPFAKGASPERLEDALDALKSAPICVQDELKSVLVVLGTQVFESWDWRRIIKKEGLMGLRLIDELLADQKVELLRQGEHNARLRMLTEQLQARLRGESSAFIEALPKLKPNVHDKVANLIATVRSKKNLIQ